MMITSIIRWSISNRFFVLLATVLLVGAGLYSVSKTPIDALPDLSDVQVIIKTSYPRPSTTSRRRSGHLPYDNRHAVSAWCRYGARLFILW